MHGDKAHWGSKCGVFTMQALEQLHGDMAHWISKYGVVTMQTLEQLPHAITIVGKPNIAIMIAW